MSFFHIKTTIPVNILQLDLRNDRVEFEELPVSIGNLTGTNAV
jgi:hypothetical protein